MTQGWVKPPERPAEAIQIEPETQSIWEVVKRVFERGLTR